MPQVSGNSVKLSNIIINFGSLYVYSGASICQFSTAFTNTDYIVVCQEINSDDGSIKIYLGTKNTGSVQIKCSSSITRTVHYIAIGN